MLADNDKLLKMIFWIQAIPASALKHSIQQSGTLNLPEMEKNLLLLGFCNASTQNR